MDKSCVTGDTDQREDPGELEGGRKVSGTLTAVKWIRHILCLLLPIELGVFSILL